MIVVFYVTLTFFVGRRIIHIVNKVLESGKERAFGRMRRVVSEDRRGWGLFVGRRGRRFVIVVGRGRRGRSSRRERGWGRGRGSTHS